jgi:hypothetical protein
MAAALQKYAADATQGADVGPRRFGPAYSAGAGLAQALAGQNLADQGIDLNLASLAGQSMDRAAQAIAEALAPENADADQIRSAIQDAVAEVFGTDAPFDPDAIGPDQIAALLVEFFARILFQEISAAAGDAWKKAPGVQRSTAAENELLEIVRAAMETHLSPKLSGDLTALDRAELQRLEQSAIKDIWQAWSEPE